jgi:hypothetical protein
MKTRPNLLKVVLALAVIGMASATAMAQNFELENRIAEIRAHAAESFQSRGETERQLLALIREDSTPKSKQRIYTEIALLHTQQGIEDEDKAVEYCEKALQLPQESILLAIELYGYWGDGLLRKLDKTPKESFSLVRKDAAKAYLNALKIVLQNQTVTEKQRVPKVEKFTHTGEPGDPVYQRIIETQRMQMALQEKVLIQNKLIDYRASLFERLSDLFALPPHDALGLKEQAKAFLADDKIVDQLMQLLQHKLSQGKRDK